MPTWNETFVAALCALVDTSWPDLSVIFRTTEMQAIAWENLVNDGLQGTGALVPPFAVVALGRYEDWPEYSPLEGGVYRVPVTIWHVHRKTDEPKQEETIENDLATLGRALRANAQTSFQCPGQPTYDCSDTNEANRVFASGNHPLIAGSVSADLLVPANIGVDGA